MLKVFLKIEGVSRPHAVIGKHLFEDERYLVIIDGVIKRKILWDNILYIEELSVQEDRADTTVQNNHKVLHEEVNVPVSPRNETGAATEQSSKIDLVIAFTGATSQLFRIENVSPSIIEGGKWTPDLAQVVFTNQQVKTILGGFIVKEVHVDGPNITIVTDLEHKNEKIVDAESKLDMMNKFAHTLSRFGDPRKEKSSMKLPTDFVMHASPFDKPVSIIANTNEVVDDLNREEKTADQDKDK